MSRKRLPLRLWAEPFARQACSTRFFVLEVSSVEGLALVLNSQSIVAIVAEKGHRDHRDVAMVIGVKAEQLPKLLLARSSDDRPQWYEGSTMISSETARRHACEAARPVIGEEIAERVVRDINSYYQQQVREPITRGFLAILERQFPRNDLYLFELLQNSVDDQAFHVEVSLDRRRSCLTMQHDGHAFTAMDVLGLSSVGLSTKEGRSIGFMGVGFKAVYKRFSHVVVTDRTFGFEFRDPSPSNTKGVRDWVLLPQWLPPNERSRSWNDTARCRFELMQPVGGVSACEQDLKWLPETAAVLLGRTALTQAANPPGVWRLDWNGETIQIRLDATAHDSSGQLATRTSMVHMTTIKGQDRREKQWVFIERSFSMSDKALTAFEAHTKKKAGSVASSLCGFFARSSRTQKATPGRIHAVLPTKLDSPLGCHVHGSWLLSVDRQDIQSIDSNDWNREHAQQFVAIVAGVMRWAAANASDPHTVPCLLQILAPLEKGLVRVDRRLQLTVVDQVVDASALDSVLRQERVVPVINDCGNLAFTTSDRAVVLPSVFLKRLPAAFFHRFLGLAPLVGDLGLLSESPLFDGVARPSASLIANRARALEGILHRDKDMQVGLDLLSAIAEHRRQEVKASNEEDSKEGGWETWAVWPTSNCVVSAIEVVWFDEDVLGLLADEKLAAVCERHLQGACKLQVLHPEFQRLLYKPDANMGARWCAAKAMQYAKAKGGETVSLSQLMSTFFGSFTRGKQHAVNVSASDVSAIVAMTTFARSAGKASLITHLLVDADRGCRLVHAASAYIGRAYGNAAMDRIKALLGKQSEEDLYIVARAYNASEELDEGVWRQFFRQAGAHLSLGVIIVKQAPEPRDKVALNGLEHRHSSKLVALPYGLGVLKKQATFSSF